MFDICKVLKAYYQKINGKNVSYLVLLNSHFTIVEDAATGINEVSVSMTIFKDIIFSTSRQRTSKVIKGVNIINGKKVFVK